MRHELIVMETDEEVADLTARTIAELLGDFATGTTDGWTSVAFSGGTTPTAMFHKLATLTNDPQEASDEGEPYLDWDRVSVFQVDERIARTGDVARNFTALDAALLSRRVPRVNVHPIPVDLGASDAAGAYENTLVEVLGESPSIDVIHLGLGPDGHCASLVPDDPVLKVRDHDVATTLAYQRYRRVTLTYPMLERAGAIVWQVTGGSKAEALARLLDGDTSIPAGSVRAKRSIIIADRSAAGLPGNR